MSTSPTATPTTNSAKRTRWVATTGKGTFVDVAKTSGEYFEEKYVGRGAACGDFDNDGDLDLLVNQSERPGQAAAQRRRQPEPLADDRCARSRNGKSDAIGARVTVTAGDLTQIQDLSPVRGYPVAVDPRLHFGLGKATKADRVEIRWPNGRTTQLTDVSADQFLTVTEPAKQE